MRKLVITLMLIFAATNLAYAGHDSDGRGYDNIARAAHQLENAARHFHEQLKFEAGHDHATGDARQFAKAARHFHRQVERGSNYGHIRDDYANLVNAYAHVRSVFGGRHDLHHERHIRGDFRDVERAFDDLNRTIEYSRRYPRYPDYDRYDRGHEGYGLYRRSSDHHDSNLRITLSKIRG
jgi:hypothetical protein